MTEPPTFPEDPGNGAGTVAVEPRPRSRRGLVIGVGATVLALVAGAAVYATTTLSGGGRQPDELVPRSAVAFLKVDLDPAARQKLAAREFFGHFPDLTSATGDTDGLFEEVLELVLRGGDVDYARDLKPWFDKRAAVAAFPGPGKVRTVGVLRSKDDGKARAALDRLGTVRYRITKGYVVVSEEQAAVDEAVRLSEDASLLDNETYRKDVDTLTGDQTAVAWADLGAAFKVGRSLIPFSGLFPTSITEKVTGRVVAGLHFAGDYAELETFAIGVDRALSPRAGDHALLRDLPESTVAAVSFTNLQEKAGEAVDGLAASGLSPEALAAGFLSRVGLGLHEDLLPMLGSETVVTLGSVFEGFSTLRAGLVTRVADPAAAKETGAKAAEAVSLLSGLQASHTMKGDVSYLATPDAYTEQLRTGGDLGGSEKFTKAVGDTAGTYLAGYVDVRAWLAKHPPRSGGVGLEPLVALGFVAGEREGVTFARARLVVA